VSKGNQIRTPYAEHKNPEGLPAQIRESHATESTGTNTWMVRPRCLVRTLSKIGEVMIEAIIPASSNVAPVKPEMSSEYPYGEKYWDVRMEKAFTLRRGLRYTDSQQKKVAPTLRLERRTPEQ
jgi:hypothetical protein